MKTILLTIIKTVTVVLTVLSIGIGLIFLVQQANLDQFQAKPMLPVSVGFRTAFFGPGGVAIFRNNSGQLLEVEATLTSPTDRYENMELVIPAWGEKEIGPLDGWAFVGGQHIELKNTNFRPEEIAVR